MTPLEALHFLSAMADTALGNGTDHRNKEAAIQVLTAALEPPVPDVPEGVEIVG